MSNYITIASVRRAIYISDLQLHWISSMFYKQFHFAAHKMYHAITSRWQKTNREGFLPVARCPKEDISAGSRLLIPISESFAQRVFPLLISTFCGFMSRWIIPNSCKWTSPETTSLHQNLKHITQIKKPELYRQITRRWLATKKIRRHKSLLEV